MGACRGGFAGLVLSGRWESQGFGKVSVKWCYSVWWMARRGRKAAVPEAADAGSVVASVDVTWEDLVAMAEASLDEEGLRKLADQKVRGERFLANLRKRGRGRFDEEGVRGALVEYYVSAVSDSCRRGFKEIFTARGVISDYLGGEYGYPEWRMVLKFAQEQMRKVSEIRAKEAAPVAQESQRRLVTEEGCQLNQRAVELSLKATMPEVYGDRSSGGEGGARDDRRAITYNFPNLTMNWIVSPAEMPKIGAKPEPETVDV